MWRNYLVVALRTIAHNRAYAAINVGGLALGLAGCLLILGYIQYERSYDAWLTLSASICGNPPRSVSRTGDALAVGGSLFAAFSALAVLIACLGLYSLASFTTERRTKEIGIRKVLGAKVRHIVQLLVWQFSKPVVLANLLAWPAAWWAMREWLNGFDVRIPLTPGPFVLAGLLALGIAVATIAGQSVRVARTNPIHALRYE